MSRPKHAKHSSTAAAEKPPLIRRLINLVWMLHSVWGLVFGLGIMIMARKGLAVADKLLIVAGISWILMFLALRFVVGAENRRPDERFVKKGVRVVTNYFIKNMYQQMFYFLVPLYASSATWQWGSWNFWMPPLLLICAVVSTMDLFFDNVVMERRSVVATMYGFALFSVLNLMLPVVGHVNHFHSMLIAAAATAPAVALLNFRVRTVFSARGLAFTFGATAALVAAAWFGRKAVPPAPMSTTAVSVGHGEPSTWECLPGEKSEIPVSQLRKLRCGSEVTEPGGLNDDVVHVWVHNRRVVARIAPHAPTDASGKPIACPGNVGVSYLPADELPADPKGKWRCMIETTDGQLVGMTKFTIVDEPVPDTLPVPSAEPTK